MEVISLNQARHFLREKPIRVNVIDRPRLTGELLCLEPGQSEARTSYDISDNLYVVMEGAAYIRTKAQEYELGVHDALVVPPGVEHSVQNRGTEQLTVMAFVAPKPARAGEVRMPRSERDFSRPRQDFRPAFNQGFNPENGQGVEDEMPPIDFEGDEHFEGQEGDEGGQRTERSFPERGQFSGPQRQEFSGDRGPRREFSNDRGPRRDFGNNGPPRNFDNRGPRPDFAGPRRDFSNEGGPRREFSNEGPRREFGQREPGAFGRTGPRPPAPRREFSGGHESRPKRGFNGPPPAGRNFGPPRRDFSDRPQGDRPQGDFNNRPPRDFSNREPGAFGRGGGNGGPRPPFNSGDRSDNRGPRQFGNREPGAFGRPGGGGGRSNFSPRPFGDRPPRRDDGAPDAEGRPQRRPPVSPNFYPRKPNQTGGGRDFSPSNRGTGGGGGGGGRGGSFGGRPSGPPRGRGRPGGSGAGGPSRPRSGPTGRPGPNRNGPRTSGRRPAP